VNVKSEQGPQNGKSITKTDKTNKTSIKQRQCVYS